MLFLFKICSHERTTYSMKPILKQPCNAWIYCPNTTGKRIKNPDYILVVREHLDTKIVNHLKIKRQVTIMRKSTQNLYRSIQILDMFRTGVESMRKNAFLWQAFPIICRETCESWGCCIGVPITKLFLWITISFSFIKCHIDSHLDKAALSDSVVLWDQKGGIVKTLALIDCLDILIMFSTLFTPKFIIRN